MVQLQFVIVWQRFIQIVLFITRKIKAFLWHEITVFNLQKGLPRIVDVDDQYDRICLSCWYKQAVQNDLDVISMDHLGKPNELILLTDKQEILNQFLQSKIQISACYKIFRHTLCPGFSFPEGKQIYEDCMAVYRALKQSKRFGSIMVDKYHYIRQRRFK